MNELVLYRRTVVSELVVVGPAGGPQSPDSQIPVARRVAAGRPKPGNAVSPDTARRGRPGAANGCHRNSGARLIRALLIVCQLLLGALPVLLSVSPSAAQTVDSAPSAPQALAAAAGDGLVTLTWQAPADTGSSGITGYEYRQAAGASVPDETAWQSAGTGLTVAVRDLANGTAYAFEVRAVNGAGAGAPAATTATPATVPSAPRDLIAPLGDSVVLLIWNMPSDDGGAAITGFEYRFAEGATVPSTTAWTPAGTSLTVMVGGLVNGTAYAFEVRAVNDAGEGEAALTTATPATVPSAPQALSATPGDERATLTWQAPASDGGSAVTGYEYRHAAGASVPDETAWSSAGTNLTATVASLVNGTAYAFEVRAVNGAGEGDAAALTTATPATVPSAPQALSATPGDERATLTWQAPASDGGSAVTGYEYRHAAGASVPDETAWQSAGTSLTATVASLANGTAYAFEVRAVNDAGAGEPAATTRATTATPRRRLPCTRKRRPTALPKARAAPA